MKTNKTQSSLEIEHGRMKEKCIKLQSDLELKTAKWAVERDALRVEVELA